MKEKVAVALSGGVDSSSAAALLVEAGYDVVGFSMQLWNQQHNTRAEGTNFGRCCSLDDLHDARQVAAHLGIPYYVINYERDFVKSVIRPFIENYMSGRTPSPCVLCNTHLKFDRLLILAQQIDADKVATGHYARVDNPYGGRYLLKKAIDSSKDQSYFLFELKQWQLSRTIFPLGNMRKEEIRKIAKERGLPVAEKPDSQEICFVSHKNYSEFIEENHEEIIQVDTDTGFTPGEIVTKDQKVLGTHAGIFRYTIGQRRGLGIAASEPLYVIEINPATNKIVVGTEKDLYHSRLIAERVNWILFDTPGDSIQVKAKIRSRHEEALAMVHPIDATSVRVEFAEPQKAITPGQAIVFYQEDIVVGGGWIREIER